MSVVSDYINQLNQNQQQAVLHSKGPAVVLAGAGSGKTRVLTTHAAWLTQEKKLSPDQILLVTFTNKAAGEMNQRIQTLTNTQLPFSGTFHSFCARVLRREATNIGLQPNYLIFDSSDQATLMRQIVKDKNIDTQRYKSNAIRSIISQAKNNLLDVDEFEEQAEDEYQQKIANLYREYQHRLLKQNAVDFDDLLMHTVTLFTHFPKILDRFQEQFSHVLIDEYQDTNKAQYKLTKLLSQPQNNIYVVGDFSQSIYAWRGADYKNLLYLKQDYEQIAEYKLEQNYRSTEPILKAATKLISANTTHPILKLWTNDKSGDPIIIIECSSGEAEAEAVLIKIKKLLEEYQYQDIAILYRTNAQSRAFEEQFIRQGIPYQIIGGFKFYERTEIKDALAYLRLSINPLDAVSFERAEKLGKRRLAKFQDWLDRLKPEQIETISPYELLEQILDVTNYLEKYNQKDPEDQDRLENIRELLSVAAQFDDVILFLENISLVQDEQLKDLPAKEQVNRISLMSLHSAKGLEFPVVFMVGMEEGLLPHSLSLFEKDQIEEERRLCYVGITRAKRRLFLSYAQNRWLYGRSAQSKPSRFLSQIPSEIIVRNEHISFYENNHHNKSTLSYRHTNQDSLQKNKKVPKKYRLGIEVSEKELDDLLNDKLDIDDFLS